jgi:hypothetical protein
VNAKGKCYKRFHETRETRVSVALICRALIINGFSDWFLPSKDELNLMYVNLHLQGIGGFLGTWYWSSSQVTASVASIQNFHNGNQHTDSKVRQNRVRAVRRF